MLQPGSRPAWESLHVATAAVAAAPASVTIAAPAVGLLRVHRNQRPPADGLDAAPCCGAAHTTAATTVRGSRPVHAVGGWADMQASRRLAPPDASHSCTHTACCFARRRGAFLAAGRFPDQPLLEDVELVGRLRRCCGPPVVLPHAPQTSGRRWRKLGLIKCVRAGWGGGRARIVCPRAWTPSPRLPP